MKEPNVLKADSRRWSSEMGGKVCPVCNTDEDDHIILPDAQIMSENRISHVADECRICKDCGVSFFVNIKEVEKPKKD